jgi:hypothetical protein
MGFDLLEESLKHVVRDLFGTGSVDLVDLFGVGIVGVDPTELALGITE